jgi:ketosteroid isomerase-like protein
VVNKEAITVTETEIEQNGKLVAKFFKALQRGDRAQLLELFQQEAVWNTPPSSELKTAYGAETISAMLTGAPQDFYKPETARIEHDFAIVDAKHAAVQFRMRCVTSRDTPYDNRYVFTFRFVDGRIAEGWEHLDMAYWKASVRGLDQYA